MEFINNRFWLISVLSLVVMAFLYLISEKRRTRTLKSLISAEMAPLLLSSACNLRRHWRNLLFIGAWLLIGFCLLRPYSGTDFEVRQQSSRDILVLMDVSNSMNVVDCFSESRLSYGKKTLLKLSQQLPTDRFGLLSFSGIAFLETPLTTDSFSFEQSLKEISSGNIPYGGTNIEYALTQALEEFKEGAAHKAMVLFSDGEEVSGNISEVVKALKSKKVKVITVQTGDERKSGAVLNSKGIKLRSKSGELLSSQADSTVLKQLAIETGGVYIPFNPNSHPAEQQELIKREIESMSTGEGESDTVEKPREIFQPFLLAAVLLLLIRLFLGERKKSVHSLVALLLLSLVIPAKAQLAPVQPPISVPGNPKVSVPGTESLSPEQQEKFNKLKSEEALLRKALEEGSSEGQKLLNWYNLGLNLTEQHKLNPIDAKKEVAAEAEKPAIPAVEGSLARAEEAYDNALANVGKNKNVEAAAIHNKGALYQFEARRVFLKDPQAAIDLLGSAASAYQAALMIKPSDSQSIQNLELSFFHKHEAEVAKKIHAFHKEATDSTGANLMALRKWSLTKDKVSAKNEMVGQFLKASSAVDKAAELAKAIKQQELVKLYEAVNSKLRSVSPILSSLDQKNILEEATSSTAEAYKLLGGNPDEPQDQKDKDQKDKDQKDKDQKDKDQKDKDQKDKDQKDKDQKDKDQKDKDQKDKDQKDKDKLNPEDQKGDYKKDEKDKPKLSKEDLKKLNSKKEAETLLRKMEKGEKEVRDNIRAQRTQKIINEMRKRGIKVLPEENK
jgi:Ca-activated chloride channel family protein